MNDNWKMALGGLFASQVDQDPEAFGAFGNMLQPFLKGKMAGLQSNQKNSPLIQALLSFNQQPELVDNEQRLMS